LNAVIRLGHPSAAEFSVKKAYRRLCVQYHPDLAPQGSDKQLAEKKFKEINEAYTTIKREGVHRPYPAYSAYTSSGGHEWAKKPRGFSNAAVAALLAIPLILGGVRFALFYRRLEESTGRRDGIMNPPVNEFIRELPREPTEAAKEKKKRYGRASE